MSSFSFSSLGVSPPFSITAEQFVLDQLSSVTRIAIDGVEPPTLGAFGGYSHAMDARFLWHPWGDEKLVEPKFDGVCQYLGQVSNAPTPIRDYHMITLMRAVDYALSPRYSAYITVTAGTVTPATPPTA